MTHKPSILIISGTRAAGKTTFCTRIAKILKSNGWDVAGLLSLPVIKQGEQTAKVARNIRSGDRRNLASINFHGKSINEVQTGRWIFDTKTLAWCNAILQSSVPCDFLVIDEIGPLEFNEGEGFIEALTALDSGEYFFAMVVVRPEFLTTALQRWPTAKVIKITSLNHATQQATHFSAEMTRGIQLPKR